MWPFSKHNGLVWMPRATTRPNRCNRSTRSAPPHWPFVRSPKSRRALKVDPSRTKPCKTRVETSSWEAKPKRPPRYRPLCRQPACLVHQRRHPRQRRQRPLHRHRRQVRVRFFHATRPIKRLWLVPVLLRYSCFSSWVSSLQSGDNKLYFNYKPCQVRDTRSASPIVTRSEVKNWNKDWTARSKSLLCTVVSPRSSLFMKKLRSTTCFVDGKQISFSLECFWLSMLSAATASSSAWRFPRR